MEYPDLPPDVPTDDEEEPDLAKTTDLPEEKSQPHAGETMKIDDFPEWVRGDKFYGITMAEIGGFPIKHLYRKDLKFPTAQPLVRDW